MKTKKAIRILGVLIIFKSSTIEICTRDVKQCKFNQMWNGISDNSLEI